MASAITRRGCSQCFTQEAKNCQPAAKSCCFCFSISIFSWFRAGPGCIECIVTLRRPRPGSIIAAQKRFSSAIHFWSINSVVTPAGGEISVITAGAIWLVEPDDHRTVLRVTVSFHHCRERPELRRRLDLPPPAEDAGPVGEHASFEPGLAGWQAADVGPVRLAGPVSQEPAEPAPGGSSGAGSVAAAPVVTAVLAELAGPAVAGVLVAGLRLAAEAFRRDRHARHPIYWVSGAEPPPGIEPGTSALPLPRSAD